MSNYQPGQALTYLRIYLNFTHLLDLTLVEILDFGLLSDYYP